MPNLAGRGARLAEQYRRDARTNLPADSTTVHHLEVGSSRSLCAVVTLASLGWEVRSLAGTPRVIAIDGRAGAGKSRFASALIPFCGGVALVRVDDFSSWGDIANRAISGLYQEG